MIEEYQGNFDIKHNGRAFAYDIDTVEDAIKRIKRSRQWRARDKIVHVEPDGYQKTLRVS